MANDYLELDYECPNCRALTSSVVEYDVTTCPECGRILDVVNGVVVDTFEERLTDARIAAFEWARRA